MKKLFIGMICLACSGTILAQDAKSQETITPAVNPNGAQFKFNEEVHDFGKVPEGPIAEYTFEFTNVGKEPLIIQNASASCGCTTPEWSKEPVMPKKKGKITVRFTTAGRGNQPFEKSVYVTSNAINGGERYELKIKGFVTPADNKGTTPAPATH